MKREWNAEAHGYIYDISDDDLWVIAKLQVLGEQLGYANMSDADSKLFEQYKANGLVDAANDDARYPGIIECEFDNYK